MEIVENSYYEHNEYGTVKVISVNNGVVSMQKRNEMAKYGATQFPAGAKQSAAGFRKDARPADITIQAKPAVFDMNINDA